MQITRLRNERIKREWTQEYVAKQVGTTRQTIQRIETSKRKPSYDLLVKLQNLFNLYRIDLLEQINADEDSFSSTN